MADPCIEIDCKSANEIRTSSLQMHTQAMAGFSNLNQSLIAVANHSSQTLMHISNKVVDEVGAIESSATRGVLAPAPAGPVVTG